MKTTFIISTSDFYCQWVAFESRHSLRVALTPHIYHWSRQSCFGWIQYVSIKFLGRKYPIYPFRSKVQQQEIWLLWICYKFWKLSYNPRKWHIFNWINWKSIVRILSFWKEGAIFIPRRSNDIIFSLFNVLSIFNLQKELFQITTRFICILKILLVIFKN